MKTLVERIDQGDLWDFFGGIHPPQKKTLSNQSSLKRAPLFPLYHVPLAQHNGQPGQLCVEVGQHVLKGQALTQSFGAQELPVHAPTSGTIVAIEQRTQTHASGLTTLMCSIKPDGQDQWIDKQPCTDLSPDGMRQAIAQAGICGLGGASFPSHIKLNPRKSIECLIINGVECEPYITSDDRLMQDKAAEIIQGLELVQKIVQASRILFAIEDNKPEAIAAVRHAIEQSTLKAPLLQLKVVPTKYPSGGEKQLIEVLTGRQVPSRGLPADIGILMHNVGTLFAVCRAIHHGEPLVERVVTITGEAAQKPGNYWVPLGTPIDTLLNWAGLIAQPDQKVIMGGPMMGFTLPTLNVPVVKSTNCLLLPSATELLTDEVERDCIRCGDCASVCPIELQPQQLYWYAKSAEHEKSKQYNLFDCIECGCCAYVCPSNIPLVHYYRVEKAQIRVQEHEQYEAQRAKERFEARNTRLEEQKQKRQARHKQAAVTRKENMSGEQKDLIAAAMARAQAKKAQQQAEQDSNSASVEDPKKAAVAAAIARAQAKKAQQQAEQASGSASVEDPKKAAVAAAIARAQAKKAQQQAEQASGSASVEDPKKAAVAAAIARAKAKKAQQQSEQASGSASVEDPKKAAVAAAIARAKAKKAQQQNQEEHALQQDNDQ